ncbi:hypothetical protein DXG03_004482 [Asterophora parasitica]|uniref:Poly A polymerase head domain-containing protein n=1 Tax=Asterophora parasitica TaxID=117018 RepID=A0A9P7G8X0_9AGAR|nr:hypothetical protein DXG03_004482 [Asterophora parasitica]
MTLRDSSLGRIAIPTEMKIELTDSESRICELLDGCTKLLKETRDIDISCRIAGGWVRDKLLGSASNDIDIALSDMMGLEFAEHLAEFAKSKGVETGTISKIAQNPDQSKHLETATFRFLGLDIDLVNLRSEEYADNSRIPTGVAFGTPLQDALRRDITINALFYNVHSREVEDHTEKVRWVSLKICPLLDPCTGAERLTGRGCTHAAASERNLLGRSSACTPLYQIFQ